jgi:hypothetical protein
MYSKARKIKKTGVKERHSRVTGNGKEKEFSRGNERNISHFQLFSYRHPPQNPFISSTHAFKSQVMTQEFT